MVTSRNPLFQVTLFFFPVLMFFLLCLNYRFSTTIFLNYSPYDIKRILEVVLLVWVVVYLLFTANMRQCLLNTYGQINGIARLLILAFIVLGLLSATFAAVPRMAILEVSLLLLLLLFAFVVAAQRIYHGFIVDNVLVAIVFVATVCYELVFLYSYVMVIIAHGHPTYFPGFVNPRFLSQLLVWFLPLISLPLFYLANRRRTIFYWLLHLVAAFLWSIAIANSAKGMLLGLFLAVVVTGFIYRSVVKRWLLVQVQIIFSGIVLYYVLFVLVVRLSGLTPLLDSMVGRLALWKDALQMVMHHPLLGVGPMHFAHFNNPIAAHPHNSLLLIAAEWGIPALIVLLTLCGWGIYSWIKVFNFGSISSNSDDAASFLLLTLTVALLAGGFYSLVSGVVVMPLSQVTMFLVIGWMIGIYFVERGVVDSKPPLATEIIFIVMILCALFGVYMGVTPDIFHLPQLETTWVLKQIIVLHKWHLIFNPRFWLQGWI